ncbi:MAG: ArsR/SmtB family transcription factor [Actinomycetota bacterium]
MKTYQDDPLTALADPSRRAIFEVLAVRPCAVVDIAKEMPISRPAVSQHLKVLKAAGLVVDRPAGTRRIYEIDLRGLSALRSQLDEFWTNALAAYKVAVEAKEDE